MRKERECHVNKITRESVRHLVPVRLPQTHKFINGYLAIVAGSTYFPGTVRMTAHAAAQSGVGGICMFFPHSIRCDIVNVIPEAIWFSLKEHGGELSLASAFATYREGSQRAKAVLIGCGMGRLPSTQEFIRDCLAHTELPMVIDADALYALRGHKDLIERSAKGRWLLTPHEGEWQGLMTSNGLTPDTDAREVAHQWGCTILLKGFPSRIFTPEGDVYENTTGNPAATTAGCGDVLAAICAAFLTQGLSVSEAAQLGVYLAGQAADHVVARTGSYSLRASDIIEELPKTIGQLIQGPE
jgi:NAD(P)H-hydrate epimerase